MDQTITINFYGKEFSFSFPDSPNIQKLISDIFENKTYPAMLFLSDVVDLVAHIGTASRFFRCVYPKARVVSFEPAASTFSYLARNMADDPQMTAVNVGLLDVDGPAEIIFSGLGGEQTSLFAAPVEQDRRETVQLRRAASEFQRIVGDAQCIVLKIDTEGGEVPILQEVRPFLDRVAAVYLEYHSEADRLAIDGLLSAAGFVLFANQAIHPHRGESAYLHQRHLEERTPFASYAIVRGCENGVEQSGKVI